MSETSRSGQWIVKLLKNTFVSNGKTLTEAPAKGTDTWYIEVDDAASGQPADGVVTTVNPRMPDHQHGTITVAVTPTGMGTYTLDPMYLYMAGYWEVTIGLTSSGGDSGSTTDSAMFPICVPG